MDKEAFRQQKFNEATKIFDQQRAVIVELAELLKNTPIKPEATPNISAKCFKLRMLEIQKQIIISQPLPKREWAKGGMAIIAETGPEHISHLPITSQILPKRSI